jgi:hypothetical protein
MGQALWPVVLGSGVTLAVILLYRYKPSWSLKVPPGDILIPIENQFRILLKLGQTSAMVISLKWRQVFQLRKKESRNQLDFFSKMTSVENRLQHWVVASTLLLLVMIFVFMSAH